MYNNEKNLILNLYLRISLIFFKNVIFPKRYGDTFFLLFTLLQRTFRKKKKVYGSYVVDKN